MLLSLVYIHVYRPALCSVWMHGVCSLWSQELGGEAACEWLDVAMSLTSAVCVCARVHHHTPHIVITTTLANKQTMSLIVSREEYEEHEEEEEATNQWELRMQSTLSDFLHTQAEGMSEILSLLKEASPHTPPRRPRG
jgi:hypothetical protein